jgi:16S rRNA (adenine1518-N6/adenine1519-N6)-dimethyltransferase
MHNDSSLRKLIRKYQISPSKRLGQNFLIDKNIVKKVIQTANLQNQDIVLEIGPGLGALTLAISKKAKKVIAVEKDKKLAEILKKEMARSKNVEIVNEDILNYKLQAANYKIVANLPYYIASPVIRKFLTAKQKPKELILIVQKEIAQRICALPPKTNFLAVFVQFYGKPRIIGYAGKEAFSPRPKVDSAVIKITPCLNKYSSDELFRHKFFQIIRAGFSQPRKQLAGNLASKLKLNKEEISRWLGQNNIKPDQRAEALTLKDWIKLTRSLKVDFCPVLN